MDTITKIKKAAIKQFAEKGYSGTSMATIARDVGIKKPSIYAHFDSKEDLFEQCINDIKNDTIRDMREFIEKEQGKDSLDILYNTLKRYETIDKDNPDEMFRIRFGYMPPEELSDRIVNSSNVFLDELKKVLEPIFEAYSQDALEAYLCIFDGLMIELLFGDKDTYEKRLEGSWKIFKGGLSS